MSYLSHTYPYALYTRDHVTPGISHGSTSHYSSPSRPRYTTSPRYVTSPRYAISPQHVVSPRATPSRPTRPRYQSRVISDISSDLRDEDRSDTESSSSGETESEAVQLSSVAKSERRALVSVRSTSRKSPIIINSSSSSSSSSSEDSSPLPHHSFLPSVSTSKPSAAVKRKRLSSSPSSSSSSSSIIVVPSTTLPVSSRKPSYRSSIHSSCSNPPISSVGPSVSLSVRCPYELSTPRYARHQPSSNLVDTSRSPSSRKRSASPITKLRYDRPMGQSTNALFSPSVPDNPSTPRTSIFSRRPSIHVRSSSPAERTTDEVEMMLDETTDSSVDNEGETTPRRNPALYGRASSRTLASPIPASVISAFTQTQPRRLIQTEPMFRRLFTRLVSEAPPSSSDREEGDADTSESLNVDDTEIDGDEEEEEEYDPLSEFPPEDSQPPTPSTLARFLKPQIAFQPPPPRVQPPSKRRRSRWGDSSSGSNPSTSSAPCEQSLTDEDLASKRYNASLRLLDSWEEIVNKYKGIPMEDDDEIDLATGELVNDRGRLRASLGDVGLEGFLRDLVAGSEEEEEGDNVDIDDDDGEEQEEEGIAASEGFFKGFRKPDDGRRSRIDPDDLKSFMEEEKAMSGDTPYVLPMPSMTAPTATVVAA